MKLCAFGWNPGEHGYSGTGVAEYAAEERKSVTMFQLKSGTRCRFKLRDIICPDKEQVVTQITPELEVSGEIVLFSDSGDEPQQYAIIEVGGITAPLIVPVARLEAVGEQVQETVPVADPVDSRYEKIGHKG